MLGDSAIGSAGRRLQGDRQENPLVVKPEGRKDWKSADNRDLPILCRLENLLNVEGTMFVPQTDTGRQGEKPQVREINHVKELGKIAP